MSIGTPAQASAAFHQSVSMNHRPSAAGASPARIGPARVVLPAPQLPGSRTATQSLGGLIDDFECGIAQAEQRVKGIFIGLLIGAAATAFFMARR